MDEVLENILPLIPIALIFALRFLFRKRRQAGNQGEENGVSPGDAGGEEARRNGPEAAYGEEQPWVHSVYEDADDEESGGTFSAWDLPVNAEAPPPPAEKAPVPNPLFKELPSTGTETPAPLAGEAKPAAGFPGNLAALSPLQRAVALAEILAPPKGL
jgi:hypothetical protein